jgi:actin-like ATPase involved in cell morphogenesis
MRRRLELELKIPVMVADDPLLAIANGGLKVLKDQTLLSRIALQSPIRNAITQQESHLSL